MVWVKSVWCFLMKPHQEMFKWTNEKVKSERLRVLPVVVKSLSHLFIEVTWDFQVTPTDHKDHSYLDGALVTFAGRSLQEAHSLVVRYSYILIQHATDIWVSHYVTTVYNCHVLIQVLSCHHIPTGCQTDLFPNRHPTFAGRGLSGSARGSDRAQRHRGLQRHVGGTRWHQRCRRRSHQIWRHCETEALWTLTVVTWVNFRTQKL